MKKNLLIIVLSVLMVMATACGSTDREVNVNIPLTDEEAGILEAIGSDLVVIEEKDFAESVTEMIYHTSSYVGKVVQLEGCFSKNFAGTSKSYVYRTLKDGDVETICALPLNYLDKDIPDGAWIRVAAIVNSGDVNGGEGTVLEVVAIEALETRGQQTLEWSGSAHNH